MKTRKNLPIILAILCFAVTIIDSKQVIYSARSGIQQCLYTLIPALFPFIILSGIIMKELSSDNTPGLKHLGTLFHIPAGMDRILIPALLGGYPIGAQCISSAYSSGKIEKSQAEKMLGYCSNVGPAFLFGVVGQFFSGIGMVWVIWCIQLLAAYTASCIFSINHDCPTEHRTFQYTASSDVLSSSISAIVKICSWVILFKILSDFLERWLLWLIPVEFRIFLIGLMELFNGCSKLNQIGSVSFRFVISNFFLAFGGICVTLQTMSVCRPLKIKYYLIGKGIQAIAAVLFAFAVVYHIWIVFPTAIIVPIIISRKKKTVAFRNRLIYNT